MVDPPDQRGNIDETASPAGAVEAGPGGSIIPESPLGAEDAINRRIFETSLDLILVCDKRGTLLRVSPSSLRIIGYEPAEMIGRSAREFLHPPDLDNTRGEMRRARRGREMRNFDCRYVHRDGH